jgi:hypothetical protein
LLPPDIENVAMFHDAEADNHEFILYAMTKNGPYPFAGCGIDMLSEPESKDQQCIPETWNMSWTYTHKKFRGLGWSKVLYGISFNFVNKQGMGLTSDQWAGTSDMAKGRSWDKMISRGQLVPRKTPGTHPAGGHSEFDHGEPGFKTTPLDPFDDCRELGSGYKAATDSSWVMKNHQQFEPIYQTLVDNHEKLMGTVGDRKAVEGKLSAQASKGFDDAYMKR